MVDAADFKRIWSSEYKFHLISDAWCSACGSPPQYLEHGGWLWKMDDHKSRFNISSDAVIISMIQDKKPHEILILISKKKDKIAVYWRMTSYVPDDDDISVYRVENRRDTRFDGDDDE